MNRLTLWLKTLCDDCNFKIRFKPIDKENYKEDWNQKTLSILPISPPEFFLREVELGEIEQELKSMYIEVTIENAGHKQPHEYLLNGIMFSHKKYFLYFSSEYTNWPTMRIVTFDENDRLIRNDFKRVYKRSWKDFKEDKYQTKKKKTIASVPKGFKFSRPVLTINEE